MTGLLLQIALAAGAAVLAGGVVWLLARARGARLGERLRAAEQGRARAEDECARARLEVQEATARSAGLTAQLEAERQRGAERLQDLEQARASLTHQFKALAQEILEDKSRRFTELNKTNIDGLLKPLTERIGDFRKRVDEVYGAEAGERAGLKAEIVQLKSLHLQMAEDARQLTKALKGDSQVQGGWGETILKRVFEASGLTQGREYELQVSVATDAGGRRRPDAVVHLPEGRDMVVDAKVSLVAYERLHAADADEDRAAALAAHLRSLRTHVDDLAGKEYQTLAGISAPDFVLMFVPVEGAYIEAVRADPSLHDYALRKNVVLLSPANLLPTLRVVEHMWRVDKQNRNAQTIAEEAGKLFDKFAAFVDDLEDIGNRLRQTRTAFDAAHNKLTSGRGNLVGRAHKLRKLGAKTSKQLPDEGAAVPAIEADETQE